MARCDALGDVIGSALRYGHYIGTEGGEVYTIDNIEIFHLDSDDVKIHEPIFDFLPKKIHPKDSRKRKALSARVKKNYTATYEKEFGCIKENWPSIERYLSEMKRYIREYTGEPFELTLSKIKTNLRKKR